MGNYVDIGDAYAYPKVHAYQGLRTANAGLLHHGSIYAIASDGTSNTRLYKRFQFNPAEVAMTMSMVAVDTPDSILQGGNFNASTMGVGQLGVTLDLMFNRDLETYISTRGHRNGMLDEKQMAVYKALGVQKDIYDIFRVILAGQQGSVDTDLAIPTDMSLGAFTTKAFDLSSDTKLIASQIVTVVLGSEDADDYSMAFYGFVNGLSIVINKWNNRLVPTQARLTMGIDCINARPANAVKAVSTAFARGGATTDLPGFDNPSNTPWLTTSSPTTTATTPGVTPTTTTDSQIGVPVSGLIVTPNGQIVDAVTGEPA